LINGTVKLTEDGAEMVKNIKALRDKKNGRVTIETLANGIHEDVLNGEVTSLIIIQVDKNDRVYAGWSTNSLEAIGLMQTGIDQVLRAMKT